MMYASLSVCVYDYRRTYVWEQRQNKLFVLTHDEKNTLIRERTDFEFPMQYYANLFLIFSHLS
jgi:hypothetical protein